MEHNYVNNDAENWLRERLENPALFPFSFVYGGKKYEGFSDKELIPVGRRTVSGKNSDTTDLVFSLPDGLHVALKATFYPAYGVSEWTVWFENGSDKDSLILEQLQSTLVFEGARPVLKGILGDHINNYQPYSCELDEYPVRFCSDSGRATHINFPYFNLEYGNGGCMLAIGWAGTWTAEFKADGALTTYTARAVNGLHTYLKPGEKIRTALFVRAPYTVRRESYATNFWRSWFVNCNLPPVNAAGDHVKPFSTCCLASDTGLPNSDGSISERATTWRPSLEKMIEEDVKVDFRWFDAGWYTAPDGSSPESDWWGTVGTWELDPIKWPGTSFRESTDFARENGMKTLMWFEPERVTDPESLAKNYGYDESWAIRRDGVTAISNNIGIPECLEWTTKRICDTLRDNRVEMYREDNNSDPGALWKYLDGREGEGRQGITECRFIMGHYKMWDDIIECTLSYGGCGFVDSCASGGGRNDLESLRRGIPLLRSDADRTSTALRLSMTSAFNKWVPFCGANTKEKLEQLALTGRSDVYTWRASYLPSLNVDSQFVQDPGQNFSMLRFGLTEWKKLNPYLLKDFYLHTPWHSEHDNYGYTAYSFFNPEEKRGALLIFRMENCGEPDVTLKLTYAEENSTYRLTDEDTGKSQTVSGTALARHGCRFTLSEPRTARILWIEKIK